MKRLPALAVVVLVAFGVAPLRPQTLPAPADTFHTIEAAEAEGAAHPRVDAAEPSYHSIGGDAIMRKMLASVAGTSERRCVETERHPAVRSGDIVAGTFDVRALILTVPPEDRPQRKLWWAPVHMSKAPELRIRAGKLNAPGVTATLNFESKAPVDFFPSGVRLPEPGRWILVVTSGSNWGCFIYDEI